MRLSCYLIILSVCFLFQIIQKCDSFVQPPRSSLTFVVVVPSSSGLAHRRQRQFVVWFGSKNPNDETLEQQQQQQEEARLKILKARRNQIRSVLKAADSVRTFRLDNGYVPELDEDGKPVKGSGGKVALSFTAFVVAAGAIALRIGGRAALVSAVGLDFVTDNPELKDSIDRILDAAENYDPAAKLVLFVAAWTAVKVLCFDAAGVALALSSGILFGGVLPGAVISAAAATVGSSVAFGMAKLDTPVRKKALQVLDEYPSLRGIEKVVAKDGLKAILTLRLAPILPIPIGMYNYIYGVTNVPILDFCGGIFLGSLKPYLLDSYLGYFGKSLIDGTMDDDSGMQDIILLAALGVSVLVGVFASQLASETWDSVLEEVEAEKKSKNPNEEEEEAAADKKITREILGWKLPEWMVGFQYSLQDAEERVGNMIMEEYQAKVWNQTRTDSSTLGRQDPALWADSPEIADANKGFDLTASICDGIVLSPLLFGSFLKYSNPLYKEEEDEDLQQRPSRRERIEQAEQKRQLDATKVELLRLIDAVRNKAETRLVAIEERLRKEEKEDSTLS